MSAFERSLRPRPLLPSELSLSRLTLRVQLALLLPLLAGIAAGGLEALLLCLAVFAGSLSAESLAKLAMGNRLRAKDGSAIVSAMLLCLVLPAGLHPIWGFLAAFSGILIGKELFGGIGRNPLNPALFGRVLLSLVAPDALLAGLRKPFGWLEDSWLHVDWNRAVEPVLPQLMETFQVLKEALAGQMPVLPEGWPAFTERLDLIQFAQARLDAVSLSEILLRQSPGMLGELSLLCLLPGMILLLTTRVVDWRIPLSGVALAPVLLLVAAGSVDASWLGFSFILQACLLLLLLVLFAADPVTSPLGQLARAVYGFFLACGMLGVLILGAPAGALFVVVLLMNLVTPWLDRWLLPRGPAMAGRRT